ncbi:MAG: hypothetical protein UT41_C0003G0079 [Candidatus Wolfebacteria bacterium GW2011_GWC2_39_22]|uniref:Uncharacterized protein n=1 Tax=Candidatus Wolfebacteria bacterium GW2011_GWC2_39_22 TaxID=1619013 RepID=A0A0G0REU8_9BACT|nr:MAG: hypothetical protein UT41_C0003G0079 [Candidatus Wolfebacteria bacterium GW2011_GWC2_39_22]
MFVLEAIIGALGDDYLYASLGIPATATNCFAIHDWCGGKKEIKGIQRL